LWVGNGNGNGNRTSFSLIPVDPSRIGHDDKLKAQGLNFSGLRLVPLRTERQKELFLGHYIEGGHMQPIYVQRYESEKFQELP
jgi:hypothetical protein